MAPTRGAQPATPQSPRPDLSPYAWFNARLGTDGWLASWSELLSYYQILSESSPRLQLKQLGTSTLGRPLIALIASNPGNLANARRLRMISHDLADPRRLDKPAFDAAVRDGRAVVAVGMGLHSIEVASTQMAPRLAFRLAFSSEPEIMEVLEETVVLLVPSLNPDGTDMIADWVRKTTGTNFEGAPYPDLYHHYAGHDNNRDGYSLILAESQLFAELVLRNWIPQMFLDVHQMGPYGARVSIPPYDEPINPNVDPTLWIEHQLVGAEMHMALEDQEITGVVAGAPFQGWTASQFHMVTNHHNIAGVLVEAAAARMASPTFVHPHQLRAHGQRHSTNVPSQTSPRRWSGGWWRLEDIIQVQEICTVSFLMTAAKHRKQLLLNMARKATGSVSRGRTEPPIGFLIRCRQHDPRVVPDFIRILLRNGVEVHQLTTDIVKPTASKGDFVVLLAQPKRSLIKTLIEPSRYPDDPRTRTPREAPQYYPIGIPPSASRPGGSRIRPYDVATLGLAELMGVEAVPLDLRFERDQPLARVVEPAARTSPRIKLGSAGFLVPHSQNSLFRLTTTLLAGGAEVFWLGAPVSGVKDVAEGAPGTAWIPRSPWVEASLGELAKSTDVEVIQSSTLPVGPAYRLRTPRLGVLRRYNGGNPDEGWTRLLLERWGVGYERIAIASLGADVLKQLDVLLIPQDNMASLLGDQPDDTDEPFPDQFAPPEFTRRIDDVMVGAIKKFVLLGGTLILLDSSSELALAKFKLPITNLVEGLSDDQYYCPGSTLRVTFDITHPVAYGMPPQGLVLNWDSPVFEIMPSDFNDQIQAPVIYGTDGLLRSGILIGEELIRGRPAALDVAFGRGRILLLGFRTQHRAQTHGTFKILFNSIYYGLAERVEL
jgi:hypothetical protein